MEVQELREELITYIQLADEKKLQALQTLLLADTEEGECKWWEDKAFVEEMDEDVRKIESGEEKAYSIEEVKAFLQKQKVERYATHL